MLPRGADRRLGQDEERHLGGQQVHHPGNDAAIDGVGKAADIVLLDRTAFGLIPRHGPINQIAFSASSSSVGTQIVDGRIVMRDRRPVRVDEEAVRAARSWEAAERFRREACHGKSRGAAVVRPSLEAVHFQATGRQGLDPASETRHVGRF